LRLCAVRDNSQGGHLVPHNAAMRQLAGEAARLLTGDQSASLGCRTELAQPENLPVFQNDNEGVAGARGPQFQSLVGKWAFSDPVGTAHIPHWCPTDIPKQLLGSTQKP
jgi:hypothetical protein